MSQTLPSIRMGLPADLDKTALDALQRLKPTVVDVGTVIFRPGDEPPGFLLIASGHVGVYLSGKGGREILLYRVENGETCIQTTLGLLGSQAYTGEAVAETDLVAYVVPRPVFETLMDTSPRFRGFVFRSFGERLNEITHVLEQVAFVAVDRRLAAALLKRAGAAGTVKATHQELATEIGSAREVVSRKLEAFASKGLVALDRGAVTIADRHALGQLAEN